MGDIEKYNDMNNDLAIFANGLDENLTVSCREELNEAKIGGGDKYLNITLKHKKHPNFVFVKSYEDTSVSEDKMKKDIEEKYNYFKDRNWDQ